MPRQRHENELGERLRELREAHGWSLREVASRAGVNHGYLSQLERGEVAQPAPSMLHKLADGYDVPFVVLMRWAGYVEDAPDLTANQAIALSYMGDVSDDELTAIRAVIDAIRKRGATFADEAQRLDGYLSPRDREQIRRHTHALLRRADALGLIPTPLDQVLDVAKLVAAGEIVLEEHERRQLRRVFGSLVDVAISKVQGMIHFRAREIWVSPGLHELRKRFVTAHEIGHHVLPWQRDVIAYLDDEQRLRPDVRVGFEREANQAAIELLAQGDRLRREADDSRLSIELISALSARYQVSLQATARRLVEETKRDAALGMRFRGRGGRLGPYHVYCSASFDERFGWCGGSLPLDAKAAVRDAFSGTGESAWSTTDLAGRFAEIGVETINTPYALLALFVPSKSSRLRRLLVRQA